MLVTTYTGVKLYQDLLLPHKWDYVVLDEGHKIKNPDTEITLACKQVGEREEGEGGRRRERGREGDRGRERGRGRT